MNAAEGGGKRRTIPAARDRRAGRAGNRSDLRWERHSGIFGFGTLNLILLLVAAAVIAVGYWLLGRGSITAAPLLLVLGYVVLIPAALLIGRGRDERGQDAEEGGPGA